MKNQSALVAMLLACLCFCPPAVVWAGEIAVAAASDLTYAFEHAARRFRQQTGSSMRPIYGSSGNFFSQIKNGAPYDLFFSADVEYPKRLEMAGLAEPGSLYEYAAGRIVLWVPANSRLDAGRGLALLLDPAVRKIAIANPEHAPYGRAALAALRHEGIYDRVKDKLVLGESISQAAQFVASGNADAGLIALSLALAPAMKARGRYFEINSTNYPPIIQAAVILKAARDKQTARQFVDFLKQPEGLALMRRYGFAPPQAGSGGGGN
jgi:molybdate transport system substrate-binding protein